MNSVWILLPIILGGHSRDPFWLVNEDDYCGREGPQAYESRALEPGIKLESVQVLFRHGARGEHQRSKCFGGEQTKYSCTMQTGFQLISSSNNDLRTTQLIKHFESDSKSCSLGQMLDVGVDQVNRLGKYLGAAYGVSHFNDKTLSKVHLYSTDTQRTMGTLSVLLSKLFPNSPGPFNVNTRELDEDYFGLNVPQCPLHRKLRSEFAESQMYKRVTATEKFKRCKKLWKELFGTEFEIFKSDDCLVSAKCADVPLPNGKEMNASLFECTMDASFYLKKARLGAFPESSYFKEGKTVCEIASFLVFEKLRESVRKGEIGGLYAIHDETFSCLLSALGLWGPDAIWPRYAEALAFEFFSDNKVRIVRNGKPLALLSSLELKGIRTQAEYQSLCATLL